MGVFKVIVFALEGVSREMGRKQRDVFLSLIAHSVEMCVKSRRRQNILEGRCFNCGAVDLVVEDTLVCSTSLGKHMVRKIGHDWGTM